MDLRTRLMIDNVLIVLSILGVLTAIVGELLGWWNDLGTILAMVSIALGLIAVVDRSGSRVVAWTRRQEDVNAALLDGQGTMLSMQDQMLSKQDEMLSMQGQMLSKQDQMLSKQDSTNASLERIVEILDERLPRSS